MHTFHNRPNRSLRPLTSPVVTFQLETRNLFPAIKHFSRMHLDLHSRECLCVCCRELTTHPSEHWGESQTRADNRHQLNAWDVFYTALSFHSRLQTLAHWSSVKHTGDSLSCVTSYSLHGHYPIPPCMMRKHHFIINHLDLRGLELYHYINRHHSMLNPKSVISSSTKNILL